MTMNSELDNIPSNRRVQINAAGYVVDRSKNKGMYNLMKGSKDPYNKAHENKERDIDNEIVMIL